MSEHLSFTERVRIEKADSFELYELHMEVPSVVTFEGSFLTNPDPDSNDLLLQDLAVTLLDKGTRKHDRFELSEKVESRGAQLQFNSEGIRAGFSGRSLREHFDVIVDVLAEQLLEPQFHPDEFEKARTQLIAQYQRMLENTGIMASAALSRNLFPASHPNHVVDPNTEVARLSTIQLADILRYYETHFRADRLLVVCTGDLRDVGAGNLLRTHLNGWVTHDVPAEYATSGADTPPVRTAVFMQDKDNVDVRLGHNMTVRRGDRDFIPLYIANFILGGNFSSRLMSTIRDEMGLTYGISSSLPGVTTEYDGNWQISVTLSKENVLPGIEAILNELHRFVSEGVTASELEIAKTTINGSFVVGLATTRGMAHTLLANAERKFGVQYIDDFPALVREVTIEQVNTVLRAYFDPDKLHVATAGDFLF